MEKILNGRRHKDARADNAEYDAMLLEMEQLLLQAGYYRARIASLSPFDKLTGGLAWCIAACTTQVDIDLTYDDDATLGDKIKVGEAIERALRRMECPHELQAHQIQGLDYPSLLPLLRWLCRRVLSMRHHHGRQMRMHALHHLRSTSSCFPTTPAASHQGLEGLHCSSPFSSSSSSSSIRAQVGAQGQKDSAHVHDSRADDQLGAAWDSRADQLARREQLVDRCAAAGSALLAAQTEVGRQADERARLEQASEALLEECQVAGCEAALHRVAKMLRKLQAVQQEVGHATAQHSQQRHLLAQLQQQQQREGLSRAAALRVEKVQAEAARALDAEIQQSLVLRAALATQSRRVLLLQRRADDVATPAELLQYERRFAELALHVQRKHGEAQRHYSAHNALADAHKFVLKETSLLNSIHPQYEVAVASGSGKAHLVASLSSLAAGVHQTVAKMEERVGVARAHADGVKQKHASAAAALRSYYALLTLFQEECARGEQLHARLQLAAPHPRA